MDSSNCPFSYRATKEGKVFISRKGVVVTTLKGARAQAFLASVDGADDELAQLEMARATGNYRRGNERLIGKRKRARE